MNTRHALNNGNFIEIAAKCGLFYYLGSKKKLDMMRCKLLFGVFVQFSRNQIRFTSSSDANKHAPVKFKLIEIDSM